jgi:hypothetical protein
MHYRGATLSKALSDEKSEQEENEGRIKKFATANGAAGDASDIDGLSREAEWSFWEKRHRR